jgi:glycosyltransferase involved in cell wall biosynthesis
VSPEPGSRVASSRASTNRPRSRARRRVPIVLGIVPARNEESTIGRTVKSLLSLPQVRDVVVVADGCRDATAEEARGAGATVFASASRKGKGAAIEQVLDRLPPADTYLFVDGDVGDGAAEAGRLVDEVAAGRLDVAIGHLPPLEGGGFGIVKRMAARIVELGSGFRAGAPLSGQRALTREALDACRPFARGFGLETAMTIDLVRLGFRVGELPVEMSHRATGRGLDGFIHRGHQGVEILAAAIPRLAGLR